MPLQNPRRGVTGGQARPGAQGPAGRRARPRVLPPPHPACAQRARPGAVSVCAGPRKRAQLPPAALRLPVFYLLPPQNSAGFATASILARGFARGGGQIAAFPRPCKSAATAGACCALRLLMRDKHGHHCNAAAGVQPWFVPESTSQLAGPEFDSRLLNLTPAPEFDTLTPSF